MQGGMQALERGFRSGRKAARMQPLHKKKITQEIKLSLNKKN
jgi:hypothetical protein